MGNNARGSTNSKEYNDDNDGGTVIDRKLVMFNNINTHSKFNHGATAADAIAAIFVIIALAVAVLRAFMCVRTLPLRPTMGPQKIETDKTWSIFNVLNRNWAWFSLEFHVPYDSAIRLRFYPATVFKKRCLKILLGQA